MAGGYRRMLARLEGVRTLGVAFGLERVREALLRLGAPEGRVPALHVAGTNGKGSTAAMAEAILRAAGLRTGLFTSPHLARFTERIRLDGREIDGERLADLDEAIAATGVPLTYFEVATLLAFLAFAEEGVEIAVLETGLGGRLDATTACWPVACGITSVGLDHTDLLGPTLRDIAREKAGIAKSGVPLLLGRLPAWIDEEVSAVAAAAGAPVRRLGRDFVVPTLPRALAGDHQEGNAALAAALAAEGCRHLGRALVDAAVAAGLARVVWPGRLEWLAPDLLLDGAHNEDGARALVAALPARRPRALVLSVVRGKDVPAMVGALAPAFDQVVVTRSRNDRALEPAVLAAQVTGTVVTIEPDPLRALAAARAGGGYTVVAGSLFLVGEVRALLMGEPLDPQGGGDPL